MEISLDTNLKRKTKLLTETIIPLNKFINNRKFSLPKNMDNGGVYAFWWNGEVEKLKTALLNCDYKLKGKQSKGKLISVKFTPEWIDFLSNKGKICLYIGKSTNIKNRISKHLKLGTDDIWIKQKGIIIKKNEGIKPNTSSQLRIGLERVFNQSIFNGIIDNIDVSYIILDGYENGINRFYLEDYFIGKHFPLFNIDIER